MAEPHCDNCKYWSRKYPPRRASGKRDWSSPMRLCRQFQEFWTLPGYICRAYESKQDKARRPES